MALSISGSGHTKLELMATECNGGTESGFPAYPFNLFTQGAPPTNLTAPANATVMIEFYSDGTLRDYQPYGFLTVTVTPGTGSTHPTLLCQFYTTPVNRSGDPVTPTTSEPADSVALDLATHLLLS